MELGVKAFLEIVKSKLSEFNEEVILIDPNKESQFPCRQIGTPLKSVEKANAFDTFQISIQHWHENQGFAMKMADETDLKLLSCNLIRIRTNPCIYDETLQKYQLTSTYEVRYNALTNAFQKIK